MAGTPYVGTHRVLAGERHLLSADLAVNLAVSETISTPTAELIDRMTGQPVTLTIPADFQGTTVRQWVEDLTPRHSYNLYLYAAGSSGNTWGAWLIIEVLA